MSTKTTPAPASSHDASVVPAPLPGGKQPRTERGRRTLRKLLDAAALEFGEKGFHEASISAITGRAGMALGSFYTYFDSKDALFRALVSDLSTRVGLEAREALSGSHDALGAERAAFGAFFDFARSHQEIYRIIDEAEFVDPASFRQHYESAAQRIHERLQRGVASGELREDLDEASAWAIMGMNVFLGLKYAIWSGGRETADIAGVAGAILEKGIVKR
ncbi:TetR/AcrR family transcriptional regulator [Croceicoccus marinus]|jgi:AcrR family transcriptional regulator|uniref:TetR/AcrR family transcriptional regulator n=1 Tax=Croceicoccus marinus TaxID=450378 RepID=A0A7G6VSR2_9SPHN|nr:TetR/AcrR family transcriptional regulator [Croceicoccus marinus]QNE04777.1 TetR/AcrR family transcriptional regulator [Croceicoccus marinus]